MGDVCDPRGTCADEDKRFNENTTNPDANKFCPNRNPFVEFAGFKWWTNFHWSVESGPYVYGEGGLFQTVFDPCLVTVTNNMLKLAIGPPKKWDGVCPPPPDPKKQFDYNVWRTSEVCTAEKLGYGRYLVTASNNQGNWAWMDKKAVFGAFTYQNFGEDPNIEPNCHRELDALEVLRTDPDDGKNAQFTIQPYSKIPDGKAMHRFAIPGELYVTIVMDWYRENNANNVVYNLYYGDFDLDHLPSSPDQHWWPNAEGLYKYVPKPDCQRFHLNLWLWFGQAPTDQYVSVTIKRFQFRPR